MKEHLSKKERLQKICKRLREKEPATTASEAVIILAEVFDKVEDQYAPPLGDRMRVVPLSVMYITENGYIKLYMKHMLRITESGSIYFYTYPKGIRAETLVQRIPSVIQSMTIVFQK